MAEEATDSTGSDGERLGPQSREGYLAVDHVLSGLEQLSDAELGNQLGNTSQPLLLRREEIREARLRLRSNHKIHVDRTERALGKPINIMTEQELQGYVSDRLTPKNRLGISDAHGTTMADEQTADLLLGEHPSRNLQLGANVTTASGTLLEGVIVRSLVKELGIGANEWNALPAEKRPYTLKNLSFDQIPPDSLIAALDCVRGRVTTGNLPLLSTNVTGMGVELRGEVNSGGQEIPNSGGRHIDIFFKPEAVTSVLRQTLPPVGLPTASLTTVSST